MLSFFTLALAFAYPVFPHALSSFTFWPPRPMGAGGAWADQPSAGSWAPFDSSAVQAVMPMLDMLVLNEVEAEQLTQALGLDLPNIPIRDVIVTLGADGCRWLSTDAGIDRHFPALPVKAVDTTGAGDTFTGYLVAGLDRGLPMEQAISLAQQAAAIMVTRHGTADVIPDLKDVQDARLR